MKYTKEQEQAIFLKDKNIMVSAGAGAGKTYGLAELICNSEIEKRKKHICYNIY